mmetsp:Transcript_36239/g.80643  ORF Transcript_36239/g.80643 Transcript_36239/m.80643 type:complete len:385 (+) Transcript_36239:271-1425(+)
MPDVHVGKGVTVGTVFASDKYICPNAVGVDIGCGMCAVPLSGLHKDDVKGGEALRRIQDLLKKRIPTGFEEHKSPLRGAREALDSISSLHAPSPWLLERLGEDKVARQLGSLGGGNHFLELVHDETGQVHILLHSGSRNIGNVTAQHYDNMAKESGPRVSSRTGSTGDDINYLAIDSKAGRDYLGDMEWCQRYAFQNRQYMLELMAEAVNEVTGASPDMGRAVNIHHNYCSCERCSYTDPKTGQVVERDLYVTRKGATSARPGQLGIIPGSMGTGSYIVRGKGAPTAWSSCSHGAGRRMSRTRAVENISQEDFESSMTGIVADTDPRLRDEAPQAYKDLTQVMANQADLVDIVHKLQPLLNVKGLGKGGYSSKGKGKGGKKKAE